VKPAEKIRKPRGGEKPKPHKTIEIIEIIEKYSAKPATARPGRRKKKILPA
jgi:hypothetical protein